LPVDVGSAQAGQDQRLAPAGQMAAVELGADPYGEFAALPRLVSTDGTGRGLREIAAQADEDSSLAGEHGTDRGDRVVSGLARRDEVEVLFQGIEERLRRALVDAHGAVALHVAVTAN